MPRRPYEPIDHTADTGIRVTGESLERLFENAAIGLLAYVVEGLNAAEPARSEPVSLTAPTLEELLVDWLNDRLYRFDAKEEIHAWPCLTRVDASGASLVGTSGYRRIDWSRDRFHAEVKGVTYHGLRLEKRGDIHVAELIFDL